MKKKWIQRAAAAALAVSLLAGQALPASAAGEMSTVQNESLKIAVLSDTHYLSPDMIRDTADFTEHLNSDRKMFAESSAFLDALLETVKQDDPDVLMISGDLTKDGEKEGHEALAEILEDFEEETGAEVYITPGNHDLNNSNAMNFNTEDGEAVPAGRTTQEDYKEIYADLVYNDDSVIATFEPSEGNQGGGLSYVARPKDGFTIISIDSARYSADNTDSGTDEHETSGNVGSELEQWVVEQTKAAKERGDTVIGLQHHGMVPHFSMEPDLLPMYLVNDYERLAQVYADAGMSYIFTGHMHANDIAAVTTEAGNTLYDIETGSVVTYPSPARSVTLNRTISDGKVTETMDVSTYTNVGPVTFTNPVTGEEQTIEDISAYGREHGFSNDMITTTVNGFLHDYYQQILTEGGSKKVVETLIGDLMGTEIQINADTLAAVLPLVLPAAGGDDSLYYDSANGGIGIKINVLGTDYSVLIPNEGLVSTIDTLFTKIDDEVLASPDQLDEIVGGLIDELVSVPVSMDGDTEKNLLDYANFIYQSHLGGEDSAAQPEWVTQASAKVQSGELLGEILTRVVVYVSNVAGNVCNDLKVSDLLGADSWNTTSHEFTAREGRTPLIDPMDSGDIVNILFGPLGLNWGSGDVSMDHTVKEMLSDLNGTLVGGMFFDEEIDPDSFLSDTIYGILNNLLIGTPEDPGVIDEEIQGELNSWLLNLVTSMGTDSNWPEDNNTTITNEWNLLTDRTALDEAIARAEAVDLSGYTDETAQAVTNALETAKSLSLTATQEEMDAAAQALNAAVDALEEKNNGTTENPGDAQNPGDTENPGNAQNPGNTQNPGNEQNGGNAVNTGAGNSQTTVNATKTGDASMVLLFTVLALAGGGAAVVVLVNRKKAYSR